MLKRISVTFDIDSNKYLELLLKHSRRLTVNTTLGDAEPAVTPRAGKRHKRRAPSPKAKGTKAKVQKYAMKKKKIIVNDMAKALHLPKQQIYNAISNLVTAKMLTRVGRGTYEVIGGANA